MTLESTLARIAAIEAALAPPRPATGGLGAPATAGSTASSASSQASSANFSQLLDRASAGSTLLPGASPLGIGPSASPLAAGGSSPAALNAVAIARTQVGQAEFPPGSNESPRIAEYRSAVQGAVVGPWCADFVSWCAAQAGIPLGDNGEGFQSVGAIWEWAERSGRAIPASEGSPAPGDLIVWGSDHVGIVEAVDPDGTIHTIEGNSSDEVAQRSYGPGESGATGYVRLG
ncbi:MAG TPA: CHAP domain-containing protein [Solirubrobacterales bacterium]|nr:CHAP domain-containing protein [Solirubrobacterales bacterium]